MKLSDTTTVEELLQEEREKFLTNNTTTPEQALSQSALLDGLEPIWWMLTLHTRIDVTEAIEFNYGSKVKRDMRSRGMLKHSLSNRENSHSDLSETVDWKVLFS